MSAAKVKHTIKLIIPAGKAAPSPPVGPALGQKGVKSMDFCKQFNDRTKHFIQGVPVSARITVNPDKTFTFITRTPSTSWLLKKTLGIEKGSGRPGNVKVGELSLKHLYHIAQVKQTDPAFEGVSLEAITRQVLGTARSLGIEVVP
jgi:large subunit ribosomal protein L11